MKIGFPQKLRGLLGKLLLSYLLITTISAVTSGQIMGFYEYYLLRQNFNEAAVLAETNENARRAATFLDAAAPNIEALNLWLNLREQETRNERRAVAPDIYNLYETDAAQDFLAVVSADGKVLAASGDRQFSNDFSADERFQPLESLLINSAFSGETSAPKLVRRDGDLRIAAAVPISNAAGKTLGVQLVRKNLPFDWSGAFFYLTWKWVKDFFFLFFIFTYTGLVFSFFVGRHLIKRLDRIGAAANAWSVGDFSARSVDDSGDEIGLLTKRLNEMAIQLGDFFALKQNLAAVEERNRLARELHDSVKQQVFALSMQIGAATRVLSATDSANSAGLSARLREAEKLANEVQHELQILINELRPAHTEGKPFDVRLKLLAADWSRQNSVAVETRIADIPPLAPSHELALYRIAQESLANIARHAAATKVSLDLEIIKHSGLQFSVADNGGGFENVLHSKGLGLKTMRERAEDLPHGWFEINSRLGIGTRVSVGCELKETGNAK